MSATVRNVLIVLALALAVYAIPGGGDAAAFIRALLSILITASIVFIGWRVYRENRVAIFSLGSYRGVLYAALGALVLMMAASARLFATAPGTLLWFAVVVAAAYALFAVYREHRSNAY